jgi:predicted GH43/DUF377 family glycosyl hydrolase
MIIERFPENPLISPDDATPSLPGWEVVGTYNCGAFEMDGKIGLLVRVTERPVMTDPELVSAPLLDFSTGKAEMIVKTWRRSEVDLSDPRFVKADLIYDAIHSHLRLAWSEDGRHFALADRPTLSGEEEWEAFGIHDPRILYIEGQWTIIYTGGGHWGPVTCLATTQDWKTFERKGVVFVPDNKDMALFPEKFDGKYCCFHRPSGVYYGGNNMWIGYSRDLIFWGEYRPLARCRPGKWDSKRVGCGPEPIKTDEGWLELYHGSDGHSYYLGAMLLDLKDPSRVIARSEEPLLRPEKDYEKYGFFDNVVFPHGLVRRTSDLYWLYYGGADRYTCGCELSVSGVLGTLR